MERGSVGLASSCSIHIHIHIGAVPYRTVSGDDARTRTPRTDRTHYSLHRIKRSTKPKRSPRKRPQTRRRDRRLCQNPSSSARRSWGWTLSWIRRGRCMPRRWCSMLRRFPWHSGWRSMWCWCGWGFGLRRDGRLCRLMSRCCRRCRQRRSPVRIGRRWSRGGLGSIRKRLVRGRFRKCIHRWGRTVRGLVGLWAQGWEEGRAGE